METKNYYENMRVKKDMPNFENKRIKKELPRWMSKGYEIILMLIVFCIGFCIIKKCTR